MAGRHWNDQNVIEGANANGSYRLYPNGNLWCWTDIELTQIDSTTLQATWTYPLEFAENPRLVMMQSATRDVTAQPFNVVNPQPEANGISTTQAVLQLQAAAGLDTFDVGDSWTVHVLAIGEVAP